MQTAQYSDLGQPQTVKVFGIMHLILAGFGLLSSLWAVFVTVAGNPFINLMPKTQAAMQQDMMPMTIISTIMTVVIGLIMLKAGILLLKKRRSGLLWSNRYAWTSLAGKVVNAALAFVYTVPAMKQMMTTTAGASPPMPGGMEWVVIGSMIFGLVITAAYPIITLILLNRPNTKAWFANRPE